MKSKVMSVVALAMLAAVLVPLTRSGAEPIGYTMMSIDGSGHLYTIDMATGTTSAVGDTDLVSSARGLVFSPDGTLYAASNGNLITIDPATAEPTTVGPFGCCSIVEDMTFDADGNLWLVSNNPSRLFSVDIETGDADLVGPLNRGLLSGLGADCTGALYGVGDDTELIRINSATAGSSVVGPLGVDAVGGMDTAADGTMWMLARPFGVGGQPSQTYTIDTDTGAATLEAPTVTGNNPSAIALSPLDCPGRPAPTTTTTSTTSTTSTTEAPTTTTTEPEPTTTVAPAPAAQPVDALPAFTG